MDDRDDGAVRSGLHELSRKELVRPARMSSVKDQAEYSFWHALVRDVAYSQIPRAERARKHVAAAEWIERMAGERVKDQAELLAHHYEQALELTRAAGTDAERPRRVRAALPRARRRPSDVPEHRASKAVLPQSARSFPRPIRSTAPRR